MSDMSVQPGVLAEVPSHARYLTFRRRAAAGDPRSDLARLAALPVDESRVVGIGASLVHELGAHVEGLRTLPAMDGRGLSVPSTPSALWCWLRGEERGELVHASILMRRTLADAFEIETVVDAFRHLDGRDLTGYEDGTENPAGDDAVAAAVVSGAGAGLDGSSFVAVQQWVHDLDRFSSFSRVEQDETIGRRLSDNEEMDDAPPGAHVKRTEQEAFDPPAYLVRRSMAWADAKREGLVFVAFGRSLDPFETLMRRMTGADDGVPDHLFRFTRPATGSYFWCPPARGGRLDLRALLGRQPEEFAEFSDN